MSGNKSYGMKIEKGTVENHGDITTADAESFGIWVNNVDSLTNSGTVTVNGADSVGIYAGGSSGATNSGTINVNGDGGKSIRRQIPLLPTKEPLTSTEKTATEFMPKARQKLPTAATSILTRQPQPKLLPHFMPAAAPLSKTAATCTLRPAATVTSGPPMRRAAVQSRTAEPFM